VDANKMTDLRRKQRRWGRSCWVWVASVAARVPAGTVESFLVFGVHVAFIWRRYIYFSLSQVVWVLVVHMHRLSLDLFSSHSLRGDVGGVGGSLCGLEFDPPPIYPPSKGR
jgi:hypothetical protein